MQQSESDKGKQKDNEKLTETLNPVPTKGILKNASSLRTASQSTDVSSISKPAAKWDEGNIQATYHPADKTYGFQKIDEPPTPYERTEPSNQRTDDAVDPHELTARLNQLNATQSTTKKSSASSEDHEGDDKAQAFKDKRKKFYDEYVVAKSQSNVPEEDDDEDA